MSRILPYPLLSLMLLLIWVLLHNSVTPAILLGGAILAIAAPFSLAALEAEKIRFKRPGTLIRLLCVVLVDIIRSNIAVAAIVYGKKRTGRTSGFVSIPLDMRNRYGLAMLATIITCTPGTLWVQYDSARGRLLIHILDLIDRTAWIPLIKGRYERLLMEIFE